MKLPTIPQMLCRAEAAHGTILAALRDGRPYVTPASRIGEIRGFQTARGTLVRWGCLDVIRVEKPGEAPTYTHTLTERGTALLAALEARRIAA